MFQVINIPLNDNTSLVITYNIDLCLKMYYVGFNRYEFDVITYIKVIKSSWLLIINYI